MDQSTSNLWDKVLADAKQLTLPAVYLRLREVLDDPEYAIPDIEEVISSDPAISTRLLHQANVPISALPRSSIPSRARSVCWVRSRCTISCWPPR